MITKYKREYQAQYTQYKQTLNQLVLQTPIGKSFTTQIETKHPLTLLIYYSKQILTHFTKM